MVGGSGGGQVFECGQPQSNCAPQRGYHGSLRFERAASVWWNKYPTLPKPAWVYRSKGGVEFVFSGDAFITEDSGGPVHRLEAIVDPVGRITRYEYGPAPSLPLGTPPASFDVLEVRRVLEPPPGTRYLEFSYILPIVSGKPRRLGKVALKNGNASLACVEFSYNSDGNVTGVKRDGCGVGEVRTESFTYNDVVPPEVKTNLRSNMLSYTDPQNNKTEFVYMTETDPFPTDSPFVFYDAESKPERVKEVREPMGVTTKFRYSLQSSVEPVPGLPPTANPRTTFKTIVVPARGDLANAIEEKGLTTYMMDAYGSMAGTKRPLDGIGFAESKQVFNEQHQLAREEDARGRVTVYGYDCNGNLNSKVVTTTALTASGSSPAIEAVKSPDLTSASTELTVGESWVYDSFAQWTSHTDPSGRITERVSDTETGLLLSETRGVGSASASTVMYKYSGIAGEPLSGAAGAVRGDLVRRIDANGNVTTHEQFDLYGNVERSRLTSPQGSSSSVNVATTNTWNERSLLERSEDSMGHVTVTEWDALDRQTAVRRTNNKSAFSSPVSPGTSRQTTYYPDGRVLQERDLRTGLIRDFALDELNRTVSVTESSGGLPVSLVKRFYYDKHSNLVATLDRRGVLSMTEYDLGAAPLDRRPVFRGETGVGFASPRERRSSSGRHPVGSASTQSPGFHEKCRLSKGSAPI